MSWTELPMRPNTLEASLVNQVYDNIVYLSDALQSAGYQVDIEQVNAQYETPIAEVLDILLGIEGDLTEVCGQIYSIYYGEPWETDRFFRLADYQRWVLILNDLYATIIEDKGKWQILKLHDAIPTINEKNILIRGDKIG